MANLYLNVAEAETPNKNKLNKATIKSNCAPLGCKIRFTFRNRRIYSRTCLLPTYTLREKTRRGLVAQED